MYIRQIQGVPVLSDFWFWKSAYNALKDHISKNCSSILFALAKDPWYFSLQKLPVEIIPNTFLNTLKEYAWDGVMLKKIEIKSFITIRK